MRRLVFALLSGLVFIPFPLHAQSVTLNICNTGTVELDAIFSGGGQVLDSRIRPRTCAAVAKSEGGGMEPGYLGLAFTDSRGQYGAARRFASPNTLTLADGSRTVQRRNVSVPLQLLFQPDFPVCEKVPTGGGAVVGNTTIVEVTNVCEDLGYTLLVETHLDSHEISLEFESISGVLSLNNRRVTFSEKPEIDWAGEEAKRKAREAPQPVNWSDLLPALRTSQRPSQVIAKHIVIRGTVASLEVNQIPVDANNANNIPEVNVVFRESPFVSLRADWEPYSEFNVCTRRLDILQDVFGADFRTSMIGKSIEVRGELFGGGFCRGLRGSIGITLARQVRPVPSAQFAAGTRVWVPPPVVVPPPRPAPTNAEIEASIVTAAQSLAWDEEFRTKGQWRNACLQQGEKAYAANPGNQVAIGQQTAACMEAVDRRLAQEAPQQAQKAQACVRQLRTAYPNGPSDDPAGHQKGWLACVEAQQARPEGASAPALAPSAAPIAARPAPAPARATAPAPTTTNSPDAAAARAKALQDQQQRAAQDRLATQQKSAQDARQQAQKAQACIIEWLKAHPDGGQSDPEGYQKGYVACLQMGQAQPAK